jgi:hypothetical protein
MARAPSTFRQKDVTKVIRAARAAGVNIAQVEVTQDGKIVIVTATPEGERREGNDWDRV